VIVVDSMGLEKNELEFLMGARAYGDFGVALVTGEGEDYSDYGVDKLYSRLQGAPGLIKAIREIGNAFVRTAAGRVREARGGYGNKFELSRREFEVASLVAKGYSNRKISEVVGLKEQSVKNLVSVIMRKLKCENRVQVALRLSASKIEDGE
jgi:DNA-binding NarL/FixJ family response regulator